MKDGDMTTQLIESLELALIHLNRACGTIEKAIRMAKNNEQPKPVQWPVYNPQIKSVTEEEQCKRILTIIHRYVKSDWKEAEKYCNGNKRFPLLHRERIIPYSFLVRRLAKDAAFKRDKAGSTKAIQRTLNTLEANGMIKRTRSTFYDYKGEMFLLTSKTETDKELVTMLKEEDGIEKISKDL